jgi:acyl-CoA thioester hydrolase
VRHTCTLQVRSYENDSYGHVNNAIYLNYLEYARIEFLKTIGFDYKRMRSLGFALFVKDLYISYKTPAEAGDVLKITTQPIEKRIASGQFNQKIVKDSGEPVADARITWVFINKNGNPARLPKEFDLPGLKP